MSDFDQAFKDAVQPVTDELTMIEERIQEKEDELTSLKALRTRGQKLLAVLDPETVKPKKKKDRPIQEISDQQIEKILGGIRSMNGQDSFTAHDVSETNGIHSTTIHKALKVLHERGVIRIDHIGGPKNTTKFYALVGGNE